MNIWNKIGIIFAIVRLNNAGLVGILNIEVRILRFHIPLRLRLRTKKLWHLFLRIAFLRFQCNALTNCATESSYRALTASSCIWGNVRIILGISFIYLLLFSEHKSLPLNFLPFTTVFNINQRFCFLFIAALRKCGQCS